MTIDQAVQLVQATYPQVYLACHTRHQRKKTSHYGLSARDATILAHLSDEIPTTPARLAAHLSVARSTLSEALKGLQTLGYIEGIQRFASGGARGGTGVLLTARGRAALQGTSVLESPRLRAVLSTLSPTELRAVARGMSALALGCRRSISPRAAAEAR